MNLKNDNKYKRIISFLKILDKDIMCILKEKKFLDNLVKKNIEYFDSTLFLEYVFYDDIENMYGSRENDISFSISLKYVENISVFSYNIVSEFKDFEENYISSQNGNIIEKLKIYKKESEKAITFYINNHNENRKVSIEHTYFFDFITNIDKNIMVYLIGDLREALKQKVLHYGIIHSNGKGFTYYITYSFYKHLKIDDKYNGSDSRYKAMTLLNDNYDVNEHTYSFQIKILDKRIYSRIIPNENKSYKLVSEILNDNAKNILNIESNKFINIMKNGLLSCPTIQTDSLNKK